MNHPDPFARVRRQLHDASTQVRLAAGSELATIRAAHRRRTRTRAALGATAAVAVATGTVVTIQQLGKTSPGTIQVGTNTGTTPDNPLAPAPTTTTTVVNGGAGIDVRPAQQVASVYTWNAVSVDAAHAVFGQWQGTVPGIILATAPGLAADPNVTPVQHAYYTNDGVTFDPLDIDLRGDLSPGAAAYTDGDSIYRVGTLPGVAVTDPNRLLVQYSPDRGATWHTVELPIDTNELRALPHLASGHSISMGSSPAGPVVVVNRFASIDLRELDLGLINSYSVEADGITVTTGDCTSGATATMAPANAGVLEVGTVAIAPTVPPGEVGAECVTGHHTFAELGIPAEVVEAATTGDGETWAFVVADGRAEPLALPDGATQISPSVSGYFSAGSREGAWNLYTLSAELTWQRLDQPGAIGLGGQPVSSATRTFGVSYAPDGPQVIASSDGSGWQYTSLHGLFGEFDQPETYSSAATPDAAAFGVSVHTDLIAEQGGVSRTAGSVTVSRADNHTDYVVTDSATGEPVVGAQLDWADEGKITVRAADGSQLGAFTADEFAAFDSWDAEPEFAIVTTADGVHVASERIADLLGVSDDEIAGIRVNAVGRQVIVAVSMRAEVSPGVREQRVLIGTPTA